MPPVSTMLLLEEMLHPERILLGLPGGSKSATLRAMTDALETRGMISDSENVHRLLMEREALMTTGVKRGFAFPHAFSPQFDRSFLTLGLSPQGVDYQALDNAPVHCIFLLLGPPMHQSVHLRTLARISRLTAQPEMLDLLCQAGSADAVLTLLVDSERQLKAFPYTAGS